MASPQKENGYTPIANELLESLCALRLSANEWQVLLCIIRYTYGWNRKSAKITYSQIRELTKIEPPIIARVLRKLKNKNIVVKDNEEYSVQKDYEKWNVQTISKQTISKQTISKQTKNYCLNRQQAIVYSDNSLLSKQTIETGLKFKTIKDLRESKDIYKDIYKDNKENIYSQIENLTDFEQTPLREKKTKKSSSNRDNSKLIESFEVFWKEYPRKVNKSYALKAWLKIKPDESLLMEILKALNTHKKSDNWKDRQFIPHPSSWLNARRWEDEVAVLESEWFGEDDKILI